MFLSSGLAAQIRITGKVVDADTGEPLTGATVRGLGSGEGTYTDDFGEFTLTTKAEELRVSFIGYHQLVVRDFEEGQNLLFRMVRTSAPLEEAVVVARASTIKLRVAAPIMEITPAELQRDPEVSIAPSLNRVTGVYMQSGALNTNRITIRGVGNRSPFATAKIRAFLDQIPLTNGVGETTIEDLDLSIIDRVEVWKGPTASVYGAGLGGMIHLHTRADAVDNPQSVLTLTGMAGSYGLARGVADLHYRDEEGKASLYLNYNRLHSDGYRENNEYDRQALTAYGRIATGKRDATSFFISYTDLKAFIPSSLNRDDYENNPRAAAPNWASVMGFEDNEKVLVGLSHRHDFVRKPRGRTFSNTTSLFTSFYGNYESRPFDILRENNRALGVRSVFEYRDVPKRRLPNLAFGGEFYREYYEWTTNRTIGGQLDTLRSDNQEIRQYFNLFAEGIYEFTRSLFVTGGVNVNSTRYELTDYFPNDGVDNSGSQQFNAIVSPRLGLGFAPISRLTLFTSVSHGFSPPTLEETRGPDGNINQDIQPEKGWNWEIGLRGDRFMQRLSFEFTLYRMWITDLLVARRTAEDQYIGVNAGKTRHNGFEAYLAYQFSPAFRLFTTYTRANYRFDEFMDGEDDFSGNKLTGQPPHTLNAGLDYRPERGFYGHLNFQFVDAYPLNDANTLTNDAYKVFNLKVGYQRPIGKHWQLDLFAGINNFLDEKYAPMTQINAASFGGAQPRYYYPGLPRNYFGGVKVGYVW